MAQDYAGLSVVFLEYNVDAAPGSRYSRWWAAFGGGQALLPLTMVDSGYQISSGYVNFYDVYKGMVDASLARPPQASIEAYTWRDGDKVGYYVQLLNLTGVTLSYANSAMVHGIVYEDIHVGDTSRYVRAVASTQIPNLASQASATYTFKTSDLTGVNWNNQHYLVLVDYKPGGTSGKYDMLQAAHALSLPFPFSVSPNPMSFIIDPDHPTNLSRPLNIQGANYLSWLATENIPWLSISPGNGSINTQPIVSIDTVVLPPGVSQGVITFTTADSYFIQSIIVNVYLGPVEHDFLPLIGR